MHARCPRQQIGVSEREWVLQSKAHIHVCLARIGTWLLVLAQADACRSVSGCVRP